MVGGKCYCVCCSNFTGKNVDGRIVSLHRIPTDKELAKVWIQRLQLIRKDVPFGIPTVRKAVKVCSEHFKFKQGPQEDDQIPSIFPNEVLKNKRGPQQNGQASSSVQNKVFATTMLNEIHDDLRAVRSLNVVARNLSFKTSCKTSSQSISMQLHDYCGYVDPNTCKHIQINAMCQTEASTTTTDAETQTSRFSKDAFTQTDSPLTFADLTEPDRGVKQTTDIPNLNYAKEATVCVTIVCSEPEAQEESLCHEISDEFSDCAKMEVFSHESASPSKQNSVQKFASEKASRLGMETNDKEKCELKKYQCPVCSMTAGSRQALLKHKKRRHGNIVSFPEKSQFHRKCVKCDFSCPKISDLILHLNKNHNKDIKVMSKLFMTHEDFKLWKNEIEKKTKLKFAQTWGTQTFSDHTKQTYKCHRSGKKPIVPPEHKRRRKGKGSCKIDYNCTAFMVAKTNFKDGSVSVDYCLDHTGHVFYSAHQSLSENLKTGITSPLPQGIEGEPGKILDHIRTGVEEIDRGALLNYAREAEACLTIVCPEPKFQDDSLSHENSDAFSDCAKMEIFPYESASPSKQYTSSVKTIARETVSCLAKDASERENVKL